MHNESNETYLTSLSSRWAHYRDRPKGFDIVIAGDLSLVGVVV